MPRPESSMFEGIPDLIIIHGNLKGYQRKGLYRIPDVLGNLNVDYAVYDGDIINMRSQRYLVFERSLTCVTCGLTGQYFAKERSTRSTKVATEIYERTPWHFNLYAIRLPWEEILMTKDHIIPKRAGGQNTMENYQTMCAWCNVRKGHVVPMVDVAQR